MSASGSRVRDSIRRIALSDPEIRAILDDYKNRGGFPSDTVEIEGAEDDRQICCDGSTSGSTNPGSGTKDPSDGGQDGIDSDDPANLDNGPGALSGVTDCDTGESICFEGNDWVPPEGWDSPTDPPPVDDYEDGYYWEITWDGQSISGPLPDVVASDYMSARGYDCGWDYRVEDSAYYQYFFDCRVDGIGSAGNFLVYKEGCDASAPDGSGCGEPPPTAMWPSDGCINLAQKGGKFVASKYDPEASGSSYLKGATEVELCDDYGNSFKLSASGSVDGGWKSISSQNPGDGYLYDSSGQQIARISESEYSDPNV